MTKTYNNKSFFKKIFNKENALIIVVVILFIFQSIQAKSTQKDIEQIKNTNSSKIDEIGQIKDMLLTMGSHLNETRSFFGMESNPYIFQIESDGENPDQADLNDNQLELAMYKYVNFLKKDKDLLSKTNKYKAQLEALVNNEEFKTYLSEQSLSVSEITDNENEIKLQVNNLEDGKNLFSFHFSKTDGIFSLLAATYTEAMEPANEKELLQKTKDFISSNKEKILSDQREIEDKKTWITNAKNTESTLTALTEMGISISPDPRENEMTYSYTILNSAAEEIAEISLDKTSKQITLINLQNPEDAKQVEDLEGTLPNFLRSLDTRTMAQKNIDQAKSEIEQIVASKAFKETLKINELQIETTPTEDEDRIYYAIKSGDITISSIVIEKATGVINILDENGENPQNILFFEPDLKKKTLELPDEVPEYGDNLKSEKNTFNILIAGKHGNLVDTMIFTHINETDKTVKMISIPRDLYYRGRKINSFAHFYGMEELKKTLSSISGYELDKYILIDMYAFIDVIDLIGGIEVTLDQPVIDPTYRTVDNGVVGTLHYEPGNHHMGGKEALRIARSRYTSSDFARAERQQLILKALQKKARNMGFGDAKTIHKIAQTVLEKTETDIGLNDAIMYYFKYQNYDIQNNVVLSSGNVLYSPPYTTSSQCAAQKAAASAAGQAIPNCDNALKAYTLLPRGNNWNLIKWFFEENFSAEVTAA